MLAITRKNKIKDILNEHKSITVLELSASFNVTEETIRRDLKLLEDEGFLTRAYGGAFIQTGVENNVNISLREVAYTESKSIIAKHCTSIIKNGDSIFLDCSTSASFVAKAICNMRLTVITNSLLVTNILCEYSNIRLICIGGTFSEKHKAFLGNIPMQALDTLYLDKVFISSRSVSIDIGVTDSSEGLAVLRQKLIHRSNETYLIADHSKFNNNSFVHICDLKDLTGIITDRALTADWVEYMKENNISFIY